MFTPEKLREMAAEQDALIEEGRAEDAAADKGYGPGNPGPGWTNKGLPAYYEAQRLRFVADFMVAFGITERKNIGPYGALPVKSGQQVRILKGAPLFTMGATPAERDHKEQHGCHRFAKRTYVVTVSNSDEGWAETNDFARMRHKYQVLGVRDQRIEWAGTGGYWTWTSPEYVEII
jgi:hypothetical protein